MRKNCVSKSSLLSSLLLLLLSACYEPVEGCLDITATNFQVDADEPCPDNCCTYPSIKLAIDHCYEIATDSFVTLNYGDSIYIDGVGNPFRINGIQFYLSEFQIVSTTGAPFGVQDSLEVEQIDPINGDTTLVTLEDNFLLLNPVVKNVNITLGENRTVGNFSGIRFKLGLDMPANYTNPSSLNDNHPLALQNDNMYASPEEGYIFYKVGLFDGIGVEDTIPKITEIIGANNLREVELATPFTIDEGFDVTISIRIDYEDWFKSLDIIECLQTGTLEEKIVENIAQSFSVIEVE